MAAAHAPDGERGDDAPRWRGERERPAHPGPAGLQRRRHTRTGRCHRRCHRRCLGVPFGLREQPDQRGARPEHPRAHGADRTARHLGGLLVRQAQHGGQDERLAPLGRQRGEQFGQRHPLLEAGQAARLGPLGRRLPVVGVQQPGPGGGEAEPVRDRPACYRQQPGTGRRAALEAGQAAQGAEVGVLGQVVGGLRVAAQMRHVPPDVVARRAHEGLHGGRVAVPCGERPCGDRRVVVRRPGPNGTRVGRAGRLRPARQLRVLWQLGQLREVRQVRGVCRVR